MLELKNITKDYIVGDDKVHALKGVSLTFRETEFVSILGQSGCGKTTLLNIVGGLDHYTDGELFIDGVSTKAYTDRDWDTYRNHRIGFVFQSYNLIPHQTVSENVELALNISGVDKAERVRRAHEALDKVGLKDQYNKKPNQLSGGQCQRVAIARAIVNNPEILLADEPTGALDSETSVQIMDLIAELAEECLVIMVTHNPELAEKYSSRIIRLLDGEVISDTDPFSADAAQPAPDSDAVSKSVDTEEPNAIDKARGENTDATENADAKESKKAQKLKKSKLSFWSAFKLSAKNLLSKIKRTVLVCFAGAIGIIGVSTVLAVSSGVQVYIHDMQNDMLSGNPVTISREAYDLSAMLESSGSGMRADAVKKSVEDGYINVDKLVETLMTNADNLDMRITNDITKDYLAYVKQMPEEYYAAISAQYGINSSNNLYTDYVYETEPDGETKRYETRRTSIAATTQTYLSMLEKTEYSDMSAYMGLVSEHFRQAPDSPDFILSQYDIISDRATSKIATEPNEIMIVADSDTELTDLMLAQFGYYTQSEFFNICYRVLKDTDENAAASYDPELDKNRFSIDELMGKTFIYYPNDTVFEKSTNPMTAQLNPFTYKPYATDDFENGIELKVTAVLRPKSDISFGSLSRGFYYTSALAEQVIEINMQSEIAQYLIENGQNGDAGEGENENDGELDLDKLGFTSMPYETGDGTTLNYGLIYNYDYWFEGARYNEVGFVGEQSSMNALMGSMMGQTMPNYYTLSLRELGGIDVPSRISVYPTDFDYKDDVTRYIAEWNEDKDIVVGDKTITRAERTDVTYTDNLAIVISLINQMIDIVTIALVAFTALSLVVSTVMIAIITYVSVIERIKEIGVIRSLGGRKRDVSALFNAETFIIGGISGIIGVAVTYIIQLILNAALGAAYGIYTIASLPVTTALIMVALSIVLTLISGLIPARLAAKKDPVDALRTE